MQTTLLTRAVRFSAACLSYLFFCTLTVQAMHAQDKATVSVDRANVRQSASIDAAIVGTLTKGTSVTIDERAETWTRITSGKVSGWVRTTMLTPTPASASSASAPSSAAAKPAAPTAPSTRAPASPTAAPSAARTPAATPATSTSARSATPATSAVSAPPATAAPAPTPPAATTPVAPAPTSTDAGGVKVGGSWSTDAGFHIGVLGSATVIDATTTTAKANHLAVLPLLLIQTGRLGIYAAPEFGSGAGYKSTMLGGGVSLRLFSVGRLHVRAAGGYTTYSEEFDAGAAATPIKVDAQGFSAGGIVTMRLFGRASIGYRGHFVKGTGDNSALEFQRHSFGLVF